MAPDDLRKPAKMRSHPGRSSALRGSKQPKVQASDSRAKSGLKILLLACACACACVRHPSAKAVSYALHARPLGAIERARGKLGILVCNTNACRIREVKASYGAAGSGPR